MPEIDRSRLWIVTQDLGISGLLVAVFSALGLHAVQSSRSTEFSDAVDSLDSLPILCVCGGLAFFALLKSWRKGQLAIRIGIVVIAIPLVLVSFDVIHHFAPILTRLLITQ